MQSRPSTVYIRKCRVKRRTVRCVLLYALVMILLLCCGVEFLLSALLSCICVVAVRILVLP